MLKKTLFVGAGAVLLLGLFFGRDAFSYVSTGWGKVHRKVHDSVPIGFQIDRARGMIDNLTPVISENARLIAREEVEIDRLQKQVAASEKELAKAKDEMLRLKDDLSKGGSQFVYAGKTYTEKQVKTDLENRFSRYRTSEATTESLRKVLDARLKGLAAAKEKHEAMLASKRQLEVDVENMQARMKMVEVAQTCSHINVDDSHLARTKDLIADIQARIDVAEKMVAVEAKHQGEIQLDGDDEENDITQKVTEYFNGSHAEDTTLVKAEK